MLDASPPASHGPELTPLESVTSPEPMGENQTEYAVAETPADAEETPPSRRRQWLHTAKRLVKEVALIETAGPSMGAEVDSEPRPEPRGKWQRLGRWLTIPAGLAAPRRMAPTFASPTVFSESTTVWGRVWKFLCCMGPGAVISVAYIDPDNYQTAIAAGGSFRFKLLFMVLVSNLIAVYLQALAVKLGTVTGMDLAQLNHRFLPRGLELLIYVMAEACIVCTDLGQVIGTAIALNILIPALPVSAGVVLSVADTLLILLFYNPAGELRRIRLFEIFIGLLVAMVFVTICIALGMIAAPAGEVFMGFLPSRDIFVSTGLYESCALLGGTLMPHAFYIGSALSQTRLYSYDAKHSLTPGATPTSSTHVLAHYRPSLRAIRSCLGYSVAELCFTLFTVAVFVNSALLIIAGAAFYDPDDPDDSVAVQGNLNDLYNLFNTTIGPVAGVLFALSLLFSGTSAGIVATMAGQVVMDGALHIRLRPFVRRLVTRGVAILPALAIALSLGDAGLSQALLACNYVLSIGLIFVTFPMVWYTTWDKYMLVPTDDGTGTVSMRNSRFNSVCAWLIWLTITVMDIASMVLLGLGLSDD